MADEDWSESLPEGWILKRIAKGEYAYNVKTGQKFHTKKDLLRYVHYVETKLSLSADDNNFRAPLSDDSEKESGGDSTEEEEEEEDEAEEKEAPKDEEFQYYKLTSEDDEFSLAKAFASYESSSCKPLDGSNLDSITASNAQNAEMEVDDAQKTAGGMMNDTQKDQRPGKEIEYSTASGQGKRKGGPKKKYELPPKKFRGWKSLSIRPPSPPLMD